MNSAAITTAAITTAVSHQTGIAASRIHSVSKTLPVCNARRLLIQHLTSAGWSGQEIADHLGISRRAVCKHLSKTRTNYYPMNKTETKQIRTEIRTLKSALNKRQKDTAKTIKSHRDIIRKNEREITSLERDTAAFVRTTTDRLAILEGRLNS